MTIDQVEGNEPLHENFGTQLGNEIDEVSQCAFRRGVLACRLTDATLNRTSLFSVVKPTTLLVYSF